MFSEFKIQDVISVTNDLTEITSNKSIATIRERLRLKSKDYKKDKKLIFDTIISLAVQLNRKPKKCRYNLLPIEQEQLALVDKVIMYNLEKYTLPFVLQKLLWLCTNKSVYYLSDAELLKLVGVFTPINEIKSTANYCHKCYAELLPENETGLCASCRDKIESCVEYQLESFSTIGTTMLGFTYQFKDWKVEVNKFGEYKFNRLNVSDTQYQPKLPFKEFTNFFVLLG